MNFLQQNIEYDGSGNAIYIGYAAPGSEDSDAAWLIQKNTYDASNQMTGSRFASGTVEFDKMWSGRLEYTY